MTKRHDGKMKYMGMATFLVLMVAVLLVTSSTEDTDAVDYTDEASGLNFVVDTANEFAIVGDNTSYEGTDLVIPSSITYEEYVYPVTEIQEEAFHSNSSLLSVVIPDSVKVMGSDAFESCSNLVTIHIGAGVEDGFSEAYYDSCTKLSAITISDGNPTYKDIDGVVFSKDGTKLIFCPMGKDVDTYSVPAGVKTIGSYAFEKIGFTVVLNEDLEDIDSNAFYDTGFESIVIPDSVKSIGGSAFRSSNLKSISIPSSVTTMGDSVFRDSSSLSSVELGNGSWTVEIPDEMFLNCSMVEVELPSNVVAIGEYAFSGTPIESITIPASVTLIGAHVFSGCDSLMEIIVEEGNAEYKTIEGSLYTMDGSKIILIPGLKDLKSFTIPASVVALGDNLFLGCDIEEVIFSPGSNLTTIGEDVFKNCDNLTSLVLPDSVISIGDGAFSYTGLVSITIPDSVEVMDGAFRGCDNLLTITIGSNVKKIDEASIDGSDSLYSINVSPDNKYLKSVDGIVYSKDGTKLILCPEGKTGHVDVEEGTVEISSYAFENCLISSISIPASVSVVENKAFTGTINMESIDFPASVSIFGSNLTSDAKSITIRSQSFETDSLPFYNDSVMSFAMDGYTDVVCMDSSSAIITSASELVSGAYTLSGTPTNELVFQDSPLYDVPVGDVDDPVSEITLAASGGEGGYTFSKVSGPAWLSVSTDGKVTGTRPSTGQDPSTATIKVEDSSGASRTIVISVGKVCEYAVLIEPSAVGLTANVGYSQVPSTDVRITNVGNVDLDYVYLSLSGSDKSKFTISKHNIGSVAVGESVQISISVLSVLEENTYSATVTVEKYDVPIDSFEVAFTVRAADVTLESISVTTAPDKVAYIAGEDFDPMGMVVTATYSDSSTIDISGYSIVNGSDLSSDAESVTISYTEGDVTRTVVQAITVSPAPTPTYDVIITHGKGYVGDDPSSATSLLYGLDAGTVVNLIPDTRDGLKFSQWNTSDAIVLDVDVDGNHSFEVTSDDVTLVAVYDTVLKDVHILNIYTPYGGAYPSKNLDTNDPCEVTDVVWMYEGQVLEGTFDYGRSYELRFTLVPDDGYAFTDETNVISSDIVMTLDPDTGIVTNTYVAPNKVINDIYLYFEDPSEGPVVDPCIVSEINGVTILSEEWLSSTGVPVTGSLQADTEYIVRVVVKADTYYEFRDTAYVYVDNVHCEQAVRDDAFTYTVDYAYKTPERNPTPTATLTLNSQDKGTLNSNYYDQYRIDSGEWNTFYSTVNLYDLEPCTIEVVKPADNNKWASIPQVIVVTKADTPTGITPERCATYDDDDGWIKGLTTDMEYSIHGDDDWTSVTDTEMMMSAGSYDIRVKVSGLTLNSDIVTVVVESYNIEVSTEDATGTGYDYTYDPVTGEGTLELDGFAGGVISIDNPEGITTVVLTGENTLVLDNPSITYDQNVIDSSGTLKITGDGDLAITVNSASVMVSCIYVHKGAFIKDGTGELSIVMTDVYRPYGIYNAAEDKDLADNGDITITGGGRLAITLPEGNGDAVTSYRGTSDWNNTHGVITIEESDVEITGGNVAIINYSNQRDAAEADIQILDSTIVVSGSEYAMVTLRNGILIQDSDVDVEVAEVPLGLYRYSSYYNESTYGLVVKGGGQMSMVTTNYYALMMNAYSAIDISLTEGGSLLIDSEIANPIHNGYVILSSTTVMDMGSVLYDWEHNTISDAYLASADDGVLSFIYEAYTPLSLSDDAKYDVPAGYITDSIDDINMADAPDGGRENIKFALISSPEWLEIDGDGTITGIRPDVPADATTATVQVSDGYSTATMTIDVGAVEAAWIEIQDIIISGEAGTPINEFSLVLKPHGVTFNESGYIIDDVDSWFVDLPQGMSVSRLYISLNMNVYIEGTPVYGCTDAISLTIPGKYLEHGDDITTTANPDARFAITVPDLRGEVVVEGDPVYGTTLEADVSGIENNSGTLSYQWKLDGENIPGATDSTYTIGVSDIGGVLALVVTSDIQTGSIASDDMYVDKADGPDGPVVEVVRPTTVDSEDGKITGVDTTMEWYSADAPDAITACTGTEITGLASGKYYVRVAETETHKAGSATEVIVSSIVFDVIVVGGTGGGEYSPEEHVSVEAAAPAEGKLFSRWSFDADLTFIVGDRNSMEVTFIMPGSDVTITAVYADIVYTVTFDTGGMGEAPDAYTDVVTGSKITEPAKPTATGYLFAGWFIDEQCTDAWDFATDIVDEDTTLYAKWNPVTYNVAFNANGGSGSMNIQEMVYDVSYELVSNAFTKAGYEFGSWNTKADGSGTEYEDGQSVKNLSQVQDTTVTLYAQWDVMTYTITFDTDGGTSVSPIEDEYGSAIDAPDAPTKVGYDFAGWDPALPETMPAEDITLKAKWTVKQYTVTFDPDNGGDDVVRTFDYRAHILAPTGLVKDGYDFAGWEPVLPVVMPAEDLEFTAMWTPKMYTIAFDPDNGEDDVVEMQFGFGTAVSAPDAPTKVGYDFAGWDPALPETMPMTDIEVKAKWTVKQFTATFHLGNGGEDIVDQFDFGSAVMPPESPVKDGFHFAGWDPALPETMPAEDLEFTAMWSEQEPVMVTITFDSDGGSEVNPIVAVTGVGVYAPASPVKEGYDFVGWFLGEDEYVFTTMPAEDITLKAKWTVKQYDIVFITYGGVIDVKQFDHGETIVAPGLENVNPGNGMLYVPVGWDGFIEGMVANASMSFDAIYTATIVGVIDDSIALYEDAVIDLMGDIHDGCIDGLSVNLSDGSISLDDKALSKLGYGNTILYLSLVDEVPADIASVTDGRPVFKVDIGDHHDFGDGKITLRVAYYLEDDESADDLVIWHFNDDGSYDVVGCDYDGEYVSFTVSSLSYFAVMVEESSGNGGGNTMLYVGAAVGAIVVLLVAFMYFRRT